jgi:hypothetical protein
MATHDLVSDTLNTQEVRDFIADRNNNVNPGDTIIFRTNAQQGDVFRYLVYENGENLDIRLLINEPKNHDISEDMYSSPYDILDSDDKITIGDTITYNTNGQDASTKYVVIPADDGHTKKTLAEVDSSHKRLLSSAYAMSASTNDVNGNPHNTKRPKRSASFGGRKSKKNRKSARKSKKNRKSKKSRK